MRRITRAATMALVAVCGVALLAGCLERDPAGTTPELGVHGAGLGDPELVDMVTHMAVTLPLTNLSDERADFAVTVEARSADRSRMYGSTIVLSNDLDPGQRSAESAPFDMVVPSGAVVEVLDVERTVSTSDVDAAARNDVTTPTFDVEGSGADRRFHTVLGVRNSSAELARYEVVVAAESPDGVTRYSTTTVIIDSVEPRGSRIGRATFLNALPDDAVLRTLDVRRGPVFSAVG